MMGATRASDGSAAANTAKGAPALGFCRGDRGGQHGGEPQVRNHRSVLFRAALRVAQVLRAREQQEERCADGGGQTPGRQDEGEGGDRAHGQIGEAQLHHDLRGFRILDVRKSSGW